MAWPEKRGDHYRIREKINGKSVTVIRNVGKNPKEAADAARDYEKAKVAGFKLNPASQYILHDVRQFLKAKAQGIDLNEEPLEIDDAVDKWLAANQLDSSTIEKYRTMIRRYRGHSKAVTLLDMTVDSVNAWRVAMEKGVLKYTRNGKKFYPYSATSIAMSLSDLRTLCNYCVFRGWMSADPSNKSKPLNPFAQIKISDPPAVKRFLTRPEVARLLWSARLEKYVAKGNRPIDSKVRDAVLGIALKHPEKGKWQAKRLLAKAGIEVPIGTIDWLWRRNALLNERERRRAAKDPAAFVPAHTIARNKKANSKLRRWIHFGIYTGLREGEVRRARCQDIISHEVNGVLVYGLQVLRPSKGGQKKLRIVWFPPVVVRVHGIKRKAGTDGPLFDLPCKSALSRARRLAARRAGLGRVRFHDLRHSFARNFLMSQTGELPQLQKTLGHSRLSTTGIYSNFAGVDLAEGSRNYRIK